MVSNRALTNPRTWMIGAGVAAGVLAVTAAAVAVHVARSVVTPPRTRDYDIHVLSSTSSTITLSRTADTTTPGQYSLWFDDDTGHARVGDILSEDEHSVTRELLAVDFGDVATASRGRWAGWFFLEPAEMGVPYADVEVETPLGAAPAWLFEAAGGSNRWVIGVHGRAVRRQEVLRAVPAVIQAGFSCLVVSYRNDGDAPDSHDFRYALGDSEWQDVDAAIDFAVSRGATEIVLLGLSMGGATVLQAADRASQREVISGLILDSPVVDWFGVLEFHASSLKLPIMIRLAALEIITRRWGSPLTGQAHPIDLGRLDFVSRAADLDVPILLLHSEDDGYVPVNGSRALALARPDLVRYEEFTVARHTKLWNYEPERWSRIITEWLQQRASEQKPRSTRQSTTE